MSSAFQRKQDSLSLSIRSARAATPASLGSFVAIFETLGYPLEFVVPDKGRALACTPANLEKLFPAIRRLERRSEPPISITVGIDPKTTIARGLAISSYLPWQPFADEACARRFATLVGPALESYEILFGSCHSMADHVRMREPQDATWEPPTIREVYWLNWYGRGLVDRLGRARVLSTPAATLTELANGSVLWTTRMGPADYASDEARIAQARARAHLVDGVELAAELERLRERSRSLVLVEPAWEQDLDAVGAAITNRIGPPSQSDVIAELNALEIPPVTEVRDAASVTADDADPEEYGLYAEQLIAEVHDRIETIAAFETSTLPALDAHFWSGRYPERFSAEDVQGSLVPALGGYIGELLVRRFGGHWVPRKNLDEAAVVIGDRAWLPFARARAYFENHQGAVQASMTKFVRAVERSTVS